MRQGTTRNCRNGAPLSLSNLGNVDPAGLRWGAVETEGFHVLGVPNPLPAVAVIGCGYRQGYTLTLAYYQSDLPRETVERYFGRVREELRIFAGTAA
ncbi:hypothetical protein [Methylogaea oryzae]|nr:hypothetical protein [Methylogaea oryzae]